MIQGTNLPEASKRRLRAGIVGGGEGAFIGSVHRIASELDGQAQVVAGAMSADPARAQRSADAWFLDRSYGSFQQMAEEEARRADGIDFVIIATPNHMHFPVARAFLDAGIHVVCDKPMTFTLEESERLVEIVASKRLVFALTHNYTGYPAVRQARAMVQRGLIGSVRKVLVEYNQDWLMEPLERQGHKQAMWRTDPARAGLSNCVGDIGTHGENLLEFITGLKIKSLCADFTSFVEGRQLEDDANILLRLENGGKGTLVCSQIACGEENNLNIRVYGSKGGLEWHQQEPNTLIFKPAGKPWERMRVGLDYMSDEAKLSTRTPSGHPEGYLEAFANIYRRAIGDIRRVKGGLPMEGGYPSVHDGLRGVRFVAKTVESAKAGAVWVDL
ncbi:Gfo/Idh/MocA family oxidoreductase [Sorangium sp. So ce321]|uniref:Gfo/Idh/MocA family protein n=1 Tax=Sorangium sp. So ce321 TaxID=3133300 RepID=UPI003F60D85A